MGFAVSLKPGVYNTGVQTNGLEMFKQKVRNRWNRIGVK